MKRCDLHLHTTCSDGTLSPRELIGLAKENGLTCVAVTDHDTLAGIPEAQDEGDQIGVEVISGVEVSVKFEPGTLHILGYFVDPTSQKLTEGLLETQTARKLRNPKIIERLKSLGIDISLEEVEQEAGGGQVGRPHFARVMLRKGYVKTAKEAFDRYLAKGAQAYVDKRTISSEQAVEMIEDSGGIAVIAHPKQMKLDSEPKRLAAEIKRLCSEGMKGIEVYSSCQSKTEAARYRELAKQFGLVITGGSDFHGSTKPDIQPGWMGDGAAISYETIDEMRQIILGRKSK